MNEVNVEKNEEKELPVPHIWRASFKAIINAFVHKDYHLSSGVKNVNPISNEIAEQIKEYIEDYGEELIDLPEETWSSSVSMDYGEYWNVLIDLYTKEEGESDLVLNAEVRERGEEYFVDIQCVFVF